MAKNRVTYGVVVVILFLFVYLQEYRMTYMALYAVLMLPVLSFLFALISKRRLVISEKLNTDFITKEQVAKCKVTIHNKYFFPCTSVRIRFVADQVGLTLDHLEQRVLVPAFSSRGFIFQMTGNYRGTYEVGVVDLTFYDFLGLFAFKQKHHKKLTLTVTPRILPITALSLESVVQDAILSKSHMQGEDYSMISELRKYQPTDGYKKIHWKASAKRNELISKNFQATEWRAVGCFVDNSQIEGLQNDVLKQEDAMMEAVVSVMSYCFRLGYPISLHYLGAEPVGATTNFTELYKKASLLPFGEFGDFKGLLDNYLNRSKDQTNLFIFAQKMDRGLLFTLRLLRLSGNPITLFLFEQIKDDMIRELKTLEIHYIRFDEIVNPERLSS